MSSDTITNAVALAAVAVLTVVYWHGKRHRGSSHPPDEQR